MFRQTGGDHSLSDRGLSDRIIFENLHFNTAIQSLSTPSQIDAIAKRFQLAEEKPRMYRSGGAEVYVGGADGLRWAWPGGPQRSAAAVQGHPLHSEERVWAVEADTGGREMYTVACYSKKGLVWRSNVSIAPSLCVKNGLCYLLETTTELRYGRCVSISADTGRDRHVLFVEHSLENNLSLFRGENGCIFLISDNSGTKKLYVIEEGTVLQLGKDCVSFVPVGYDSDGRPTFFGRTSFTSAWTPYGSLRKYKLPLELRRYGIEFFSQNQHFLVTSTGGIRRLYRVGRTSPKMIWECIGNIQVDSYALWEGRQVNIQRPVVYGVTSVHEASSRDGTRVPYVLVSKEGVTTKGLLVIIYGAYGLPTVIGTSRWKPFVEEGWALAFGLIRGGGDFGDAWADAARTYKKWKSIDDTVAVIKDAQKRTNLSWESTCLYGRSAGGYTLGAVVAKYGDGGLIGAAYAEVPFVDVLTTTSTPSLPLTILEYREFGNPLKNPRDLKTIRELSPVDALPPEGAPGIFVLSRTSLNDREVFPNESLKWICHLRGTLVQKGLKQKSEKYLAITEGHGHFVRGDVGYRQKAEDFILLNSWLASSQRVA